MKFLSTDIKEKVFQYTSILKRVKIPNNIKNYVNQNSIICPKNDDIFKTIMYSLMIHPKEYEKYGLFDDWYKLYDWPEYNYELKFYEQNNIETLITKNLDNQRQFIQKLKHNDIIIDYESIQRYEKFINLFKKCNKFYRKTIIVPTLDIDIIWHAHMLTPKMYTSDMKNTLGYVLDHNDEIDQDQLKSLFTNTEILWKSTYNEPYYIHKKKSNKNKNDNDNTSQCSSSTPILVYCSTNHHISPIHTDSNNPSISDSSSSSCSSCGGCSD
jgi:hypothetical protein